MLDVINVTHCSTLKTDNKLMNVSTSNVICTLNPTKNNCLIDGGGPLLIQLCPNRWVLIGTASSWQDCGQENVPGIYTKVSDYRQWIDAKTGPEEDC
ncbi:Transmembrane protease serine 11B [Halocaridina rubra]|uniref:Transmembrane protease serine 11B n=1 Tax=Halocaridina rubra TaxID=373956 RepID=A0AAN8X6S9_HALRR